MDVLVIGAGPAGIGAAIRLRELGFDAHVIEKASELGGTWRDNVYPGCACDIPSALYSYSFAPRRWSAAFSRQPEILAYLRETARSHCVVPQYGTEMLDAAWDGSRWQVRTSSGVLSVRAIVSATGPWHEPRIPLDASVFQGEIFHSARWRDFSGRRVAVVGTGASAVQFVPEIQPAVDQLYLFQRTAPWVLPKPSLKLPRPVVFGFLELFS